MLMLIFAASGAWLAEHNAQPDEFGSIPAAMWWAVATLTTVGYGDVTPVTVAGKFFGACVTIVGIGMAALPAGIIASGLNDQIHRRKKSLEQRFRQALSDGIFCDEEQQKIETLRKQLGLSHRAAKLIMQSVRLDHIERENTCKTCGKHLGQGPLTSADHDKISF